VDVENLEAVRHPEDNESAGEAKQNSLQLYLSSTAPHALH